MSWRNELLAVWAVTLRNALMGARNVFFFFELLLFIFAFVRIDLIFVIYRVSKYVNRFSVDRVNMLTIKR